MSMRDNKEACDNYCGGGRFRPRSSSRPGEPKCPRQGPESNPHGVVIPEIERRIALYAARREWAEANGIAHPLEKPTPIELCLGVIDREAA